ncbi:MAG: phage head closure protein [Rhizobiales bacterium]|nr:phage head closure protein [Hyphomicrobiales bacterium]
MRAGKLDRTIRIDTYEAGTPDDYGIAADGWEAVATVRAQILQQATDEYLRGYGEGAATVVIFRIRWLDGVTVEHRVTYDGAAYNIREVKEIGRRVGLELRCEEVRS